MSPGQSLFSKLKARLSANEQSEPISECVFRWRAAYRVDEVDECVARVSVRIKLEPDSSISPDELDAAKDGWSEAAARVWGRDPAVERRSGTCRCEQYGMEAVVEWVARGQHHVVSVHPGPGRADMTTLFLAEPSEVFAHELGHMLGYADEYEDERCPERSVTTDDSIMQTIEGSPRPRHYSRLASWLSARSECEYGVAEQ